MSAPTLVQSTSAESDFGNDLTLSLSGVGAGHLLAITVTGVSFTAPTLVITDSQNSVTTALAFQADNSTADTWVGMYYVPNASAGTHVVTYNFTAGSVGHWFYYLGEYTGVATGAADAVSTVVTGGTGTSATAANITPSASGDLVVVPALPYSVTAVTWTSPLQADPNVPENFYGGVGYGVLSSSAAFGANLTWTGSQVWGIAAMAFKASGGGGTSVGSSILLLGVS